MCALPETFFIEVLKIVHINTWRHIKIRAWPDLPMWLVVLSAFLLATILLSLFLPFPWMHVRRWSAQARSVLFRPIQFPIWQSIRQKKWRKNTEKQSFLSNNGWTRGKQPNMGYSIGIWHSIRIYYPSKWLVVTLELLLAAHSQVLPAFGQLAVANVKPCL